MPFTHLASPLIKRTEMSAQVPSLRQRRDAPMHVCLRFRGIPSFH